MSYNWYDQTTGTPAANINWSAITSDSTGKYLVATQYNNSIWTSSNLGFSGSWVNQPIGISTDVFNEIVSDSTGQYLALTDSNSNVWTSNNYGVSSSWINQTTDASLNSPASYLYITSDSTGQYLAVAAQSADLWTSSSYGVNGSWINRTSGTSLSGLTWLNIASDSTGQNLVAVSGFGGLNGIYTSNNYGVNWVNQEPLLNGLGWGRVASNSSGQYLTALVFGGAVYISNNYGITGSWTIITPPSIRSYSSVTMNDTGNIIALTSQGYDIWVSTNYGSSWINTTQDTSATNQNWNSIISNSSGNFLAALVNGGDIWTNQPPIVCFKEDTKILTDKDYKSIQDLRKRDLVKTLKHGFLPIDMIGKKEIYHIASTERIKDQLYKCSKDQYPELTEDLIITGCHSILIDEFISEEQREKTIQVNGDTYVTDCKYRLPACVDERTTVYEKPGTYTIYHLALENDDYYMNYGIYANGLLVETCSKRYLKELSNMTLIE
jgi:hypothetical protein